MIDKPDPDFDVIDAPEVVEVVEPEVPDIDCDSGLSCPSKFPPEKWKRKTEGFKRNYYTVVLKRKLNGGK